MTKQLRVPDPAHDVIAEIAAEKDISKKAAVSVALREAGYDV